MYDGVIMSHLELLGRAAGGLSIRRRPPAPKRSRPETIRPQTNGDMSPTWRGAAGRSDPRPAIAGRSTERGSAHARGPLRRARWSSDPRRPRAGAGRALGCRPAARRRPSWPFAPGRRRLLCSRSCRATALVARRALGRDPRLLPRRRIGDPAREPDRPPEPRSPLRHARLRIGKSQNAIIAKLVAQHLHPGPGPHRPRFRLRRAHPLRAPGRAVAPRRSPGRPSSSPAPPPASGTRRCRPCMARCWPPPSPTPARCPPPRSIERAVGADGRRLEAARRSAAPRRRPRGGRRRGGTDDGADHRMGTARKRPSRNKHGQRYCPSRSPARPERCPPRPTTASSATAGSWATRPPITRPSPSRWSSATGPIGASKPPTWAGTSSANTSPRRTAPRLLAAR